MIRYDIDAKQRIQDQLQLKYADECFVLTASYTETFVENAALDLRPDRTLMLRFELKYIGEFNYKTDQLEPRVRRSEPGAEAVSASEGKRSFGRRNLGHPDPLDARRRPACHASATVVLWISRRSPSGSSA